MGALRPDIEGWIGRGLQADEVARLNIARLLATCCQLGVKHDTRGDRTFANITSIMARPAGTPERAQSETAQVAFSLSADPFPAAEYAALPQWVQQTIAKSPEYQRRRSGPSGPALADATRQRLGGGGDSGSGSGGGAPAVTVPAAAASPPRVDADLDDAIPFLTCATVEPSLKRRFRV